MQLGLMYPCLLGARMLGSTAFPWTLSGLLSLRIEDCLLYEFIGAGIILSIVAYDYQVQVYNCGSILYFFYSMKDAIR